jgi:hypothetical protein
MPQRNTRKSLDQALRSPCTARRASVPRIQGRRLPSGARALSRGLISALRLVHATITCARIACQAWMPHLHPGSRSLRSSSATGTHRALSAAGQTEPAPQAGHGQRQCRRIRGEDRVAALDTALDEAAATNGCGARCASSRDRRGHDRSAGRDRGRLAPPRRGVRGAEPDVMVVIGS